MQTKFSSLSVILSALFKVDCSLVRCAAPKCPLGQTAQIKPGTCCPTCVPCGKVFCPLIACVSGSIPVTQPGECCPTCVPPPDCCLTFLNSPDDTVAVTVPGQCCPTFKQKPDCKNVLCPGCVGEIEPGNCCGLGV
ncbi:hypothetical protein C8J57DRAFT_1359206 [Mycena rebaudengoi]|nr:hypothetical protein C8J57DRAFT_1359206 [Mycena rebaudengoi]